MTERFHKKMFAITDDDNIVETEAYECPQKSYWWCPDIGYSICEGYGVFNTLTEAVSHLKHILEVRIEANQIRLKELMDGELVQK